ncbi:MAG: cyclic nucleotide-binding domain-containing protein [Actinobacteria bacterium]|nr:cyclic nucleotide-binding domain-containing protein [Actinomycetota bacterium]
MAANHYADKLSALPLFSSCTKRELTRIARAGDEVHLAEGALVVDQGDMGREAFVILSGTALVKRNGRKVATLGPGDPIGELSLLDRGPRTATVVATSELTVFVLSTRRFNAVLDESPGLSRKLLAFLAGRVRDLDSKTFG